jgi:hypothetical protein
MLRWGFIPVGRSEKGSGRAILWRRPSKVRRIRGSLAKPPRCLDHYPRGRHSEKRWQYAALRVALLKVATPLGRNSGKGAGKGQPMWWRIDPEKINCRSWLGRTNRRRQRDGRPLLDANGFETKD